MVHKNLNFIIYVNLIVHLFFNKYETIHFLFKTLIKEIEAKPLQFVKLSLLTFFSEIPPNATIFFFVNFDKKLNLFKFK